jgi:hypothetical protein
MSSDHDRDANEHRRVQRAEQPEHLHGQPGGPENAAGMSPYAGSLLGNPVLNGRGNGPVKAAVMRQAQQTYGNRAVQRFIQRCAACNGQEEPVQRQTPGEQPTQGAAPSNGGGGAAGAGGPARLEGSTVDISGAVVNINSGMTRASGVLQVDTLIANSVVSSNYTPGAGNIQ